MAPTARISDPFAVVTVLMVIEGIIFYLSDHRWTRRLLDVIPSMFWIYFLPLLATTAHILPNDSSVYPFISKNLLPASLILLLLAVDIRAILRLGIPALLMMAAGSAGIVLGGPLVLLIFRRWLPPGIWSGLGALSASWTGGSANMLAVKEGLHTPDPIYTLMIVVDSIVPYVWMAILMAAAKYQTAYDRWNRSDMRIMNGLNATIARVDKIEPRPLTVTHTAVMLAVAVLGSLVSSQLAAKLPEVKNAIAPYTWTIILATTLGIGLSFTGARKLEAFGASKVGYALLYLVLASFGARANLTDLRATPILILAGLVWVAIHALFTLGASRVLRAPMFLAAAASQANIGGVASAPVVAEAYQPALATVGLLLAILGNIVGTYLGIICGQLCKLVSSPG